MAMDGTASDEDHTINESNADRERDHESMEVGVTAPERTPGDVSQASTASERPRRCTMVEARVGRGNYEPVGVAPSWDRNKAFNYRKFPKLVCRGYEEEAFVIVVYSKYSSLPSV